MSARWEGTTLKNASYLVSVAALILTIASCTRPKPVEFLVNFEGGSAENLRLGEDGVVRFTLAPDPVGNERLWFYFLVRATEPVQPWFILEKRAPVHQSNWDVVRPVFSVDGRNWVRANEVSEVKPGFLLRRFGRKPTLRFRSPIMSRTLWVAYDYPYTTPDLQRFLGTISSDPKVRISTFGHSSSGKPIPRVSVEPMSQASPPKVIWVLCREHPGETPASFVLEGFLASLLGDRAGRELSRRYRFEVVPFVNLSGVNEGRYYRNPRGIDLAQDWGTFASEEMKSVHEAMRADLETDRVALVLNLHSANGPKSHFFLEIPGEWLPTSLSNLQQRLIQGARGAHPQLQVDQTVKTWDYPVICSNYLNTHYRVLCFYSESNYSVGADGSTVTPESLRSLGTSLVRIILGALSERRE